MGVLRFLRQRVLAFDRIGSRIPQLFQVWLLELFFVMPLAFFVGKAIDIRARPPSATLGGGSWCCSPVRNSTTNPKERTHGDPRTL